MPQPFKATGGARIGWVNATWPLARLSVSADSLRLSVTFIGDYSFPADTVISIARYTTIPVLGWGIKIQHSIPDYPAHIIFWCLGRPEALLAGIRDSGFQPHSPISALPHHRGIPFRWSALIVVLAVWNGLFLIRFGGIRSLSQLPAAFDSFVLLPIGFLFAATILTIRMPIVQRLVLKPGRSLGEIRPFLNLVLLVSGSIFVILLLLTVIQSLF